MFESVEVASVAKHAGPVPTSAKQVCTVTSDPSSVTLTKPIVVADVEIAALAVLNGFLKSAKANTAAACTVAAVVLSAQVSLVSIDDVHPCYIFVIQQQCT